MKHSPRLPLPPPLRGSEEGSFAEDTVKRRMPDIARQVLAENALSTAATTAVQALIADMPEGQLRPLQDTHAPDSEMWQDAINRQQQQTWLSAPWFFSETYFYRRLIEAVDYFGSSYDPFAVHKKKATEAEPDRLAALAEQLSVALSVGWNVAAFHRMLAADLWGNQADLSLWATDATDKPDHEDEGAQQSHTLVDDSTAVSDYMASLPPGRVDFILDNAGFELYGDLALADYLLSSGKVERVHFHAKLHPTFVSDATADDILQTVAFLARHSSAWVSQMGQRLALVLGNGRLQIQTNLFWTSPHPLWLLPADLRQTLEPAQLVISKGDANYRRALGDAHWPYHTPLAEIVSTFPTPILFLRTCKSDVMAGLPAGRRQALDAQEPGWDTNGRWGLIQFVR